MGVTPEEFDRVSKQVFEETVFPARENGLELNNIQFLRLVLAYLGIELSVSLEEAERIQWTAISAGAVMPHIAELLGVLREKGIRSGVISNLMWSGGALSERIERLLAGLLAEPERLKQRGALAAELARPAAAERLLAEIATRLSPQP